MSAKKILVIDDEEEVQSLLGEILQMHGYEVSCARNGDEGLKEARNIRPDLIIMDIMMPLTDGFTAHERMKEIPETSKIPVLFVTGKTTPDFAKRAIAQGAAAFIEKPFDVDVLLNKIRSILEI